MVEAGRAYRKARDILLNAGIQEAAVEAGLLFEHVAGKNRFLAEGLTAGQEARLEQLCELRAAGQPLQYVLGKWVFMDIPLHVGPGVLIPRPETEEVCRQAGSLLPANGAPAILDLCAGTGAIALALQAARPNARVTAVEFSPAAFAYLQKNIALFGEGHARAPEAVLANALEFYRGLQPESLDLIVSNPPYVTPGEYMALERELYHEPRQALVPPTGEDGLLFYREIVQKYAFALKKGGAMVFEIGSGQGRAVADIMRAGGFARVEIMQDINGRPRIAWGRHSRGAG